MLAKLEAAADIAAGACTADRGFVTVGSRIPAKDSQTSTPCLRFRRKRRAPSSEAVRAQAAVHFVGCAKNIALERVWETARQIEKLGGADSRSAAASVAAYAATVFEDVQFKSQWGAARWALGVSRRSAYEALAEDHTARALISWAVRNERVQVIVGSSAPSAVSTSRTERLALCRNVLLRSVLKERRGRSRPLPRGRAHREPLLVVLDLDCRPSLPPTAFSSALAAVRSGAWDVLTANSVPFYYDGYALRSATLGMQHDCVLAGQQTGVSLGVSSVRAYPSGACTDYAIALEVAGAAGSHCACSPTGVPLCMQSHCACSPTRSSVL
jgi:hypothetical protein